MAYLSARGSGRIDAVSLLRAPVSRELYTPIFPRLPAAEVPISHVTSDLHTPASDSAGADELCTTHCDKGRWLGPTDTIQVDICTIPIDKLWYCRNSARTALVTFARERLSRQLAASGAPADIIAAAKKQFDPGVLTLGFARRFATWKRPYLLLHDPNRLLRILSSTQRPIQLIMAGKAHPSGIAGRSLIEHWTMFIRQPGVRPHAMFLADYDIHMTMRLV